MICLVGLPKFHSRKCHFIIKLPTTIHTHTFLQLSALVQLRKERYSHLAGTLRQDLLSHSQNAIRDLRSQTFIRKFPQVFSIAFRVHRLHYSQRNRNSATDKLFDIRIIEQTVVEKIRLFFVCVHYFYLSDLRIIYQLGLMRSLPEYKLVIVDGCYPFKNTHITKIFEISVEEELPLSNFTHRLFEVYHNIEDPFLVNISQITKIQENRIKINYEYVQTPLHHYIRRYIHDNLQLRMEKLVMAIRDIAYKFATKQVNTLKAINIRNIGVKMTDAYRQSMFVGKMKNPQASKKDILMPDFKFYISPNSCEFIEKYEDVGRVVIQVDKIICQGLRREIDRLIQEIEAEQNQNSYKNTQPSSSTALKRYSASMSATNFKQLLERQAEQLENSKKQKLQEFDPFIGFSPKRKRRKKRLQTMEGLESRRQSSQNIFPQLFNVKQPMVPLQKENREDCSSTSDFYIKSQVSSPIICEKAMQAIEKSRQNLQKFKNKFLKKKL